MTNLNVHWYLKKQREFVLLINGDDEIGTITSVDLANRQGYVKVTLSNKQVLLLNLQKSNSEANPYSGRFQTGSRTAFVAKYNEEKGKSDDPTSPDYVPSINMGYHLQGSSTPVASMSRYERVSRRNASKKDREVDLAESLSRDTAVDALLDLSNIEPKKDEVEQKENEVTTPHESCIKMIADANLETKRVLKELERLQEENESLRQQLREKEGTERPLRASYLESGNSDEKTTFFTGLPSYKCFLWLVTFLQGVLPKSDILSPADIVLLVYMKIRLNVLHTDLAYRFGVSKATVSSLIDNSIPKIAEKLKFFIRWPSREDVRRTRPQCFLDAYPDCVSIIDCTEIFIECPSSFSSRSATYSNYKHTNTVKYLVSITPCGSVSFISKSYGGRTSDKVITYESGYLDNLIHGDVVLADRGFLIQDEVNSRGATLVIPAFTKGKDQFSAKDVETSRRISRVRIHVERMMERLKNFRILSTRMSMNMVPHSDNIMTISSATVNMHPNLVN